MTDPRIGTIGADGRRVMPAVNLHGAPYETHASTFPLDETHFVVLPVNYDDAGLLDELRASLKPAPKGKVTDGS